MPQATRYAIYMNYLKTSQNLKEIDLLSYYKQEKKLKEIVTVVASQISQVVEMEFSPALTDHQLRLFHSTTELLKQCGVHSLVIV